MAGSEWLAVQREPFAYSACDGVCESERGVECGESMGESECDVFDACLVDVMADERCTALVYYG